MNGLASWSSLGKAAPFWGDLWRALDAFPGPGPSSWEMREDERAYMLCVKVPGYGPDELAVSLKDGILRVYGRHEEGGPASEDAQRSFSGSFQRSLVLPSAVNQKEVKASYGKGVLYLELPKAGEPEAAQGIPLLEEVKVHKSLRKRFQRGAAC